MWNNLKQQKLNDMTNFFNIVEVELHYKTKVKPADRPQITASTDARDILLTAFNEETFEHHEEFYILLLNRNNKVLGIKKHSSGGNAGCIIEAKFIVQAAILANACGVILCHNHPSGNIKPSEADKSITDKVKTGCSIFDIKVLDHIILGEHSKEGNYFSFADEGLL